MAKTKNSKGKWRVYDDAGKILKDEKGTPVDGGGYVEESNALHHVEAINNFNRINGGKT